MKEVYDQTHRFAKRPHFEARELDRLFERVLKDFFKSSSGMIPLPIPTDDLTRLIERDTSDFDPGADLSRYGPGVEGVTHFFPNKKPRVQIAAELAYDDRRQNRYRTTLTHEFGHVHLHSHLFQLANGKDDGDLVRNNGHLCMRDKILSAPQRDWLEWQAGYACGALLMPISAIVRIARECAIVHDLPVATAFTGKARAYMLSHTVSAFQVSEQAARVRLAKLGTITD